MFSNLNENGIPRKKGMADNMENITSAMTDLLDQPLLQRDEHGNWVHSNSCGINGSNGNERERYNFWRYKQKLP